MNFDNVLKLRISRGLRERLDEIAARADRTKSDVTREAVVIGLHHLARRVPGDDGTPPQAA
jgi:predicted DNA-binding protein